MWTTSYSSTTVASATAPFRDAIEEGRTGFTARNPEEWHRHLETLIVSAETRRKMGLLAREAALSAFGPQATFGLLRRSLARPYERTR